MLQIELIIFNEGSTDNTPDKITKFRNKSNHYIQNRVAKDDYPTRNLGLSLLGCKYICIMDANDIAFPNRLETQFRYFGDHLNVGCIGGLSGTINESGKPLGLKKRPLSNPVIKTYLLKDNYFTYSTIMLRSHLIKENQLLYNEIFKYSGDYDFIIRVSKVAS